MYCDRSSYRNKAIFCTIFFGGILYFFASCLSDKLGRRTILRLGIVLGIVGFLVLLISPGLTLTIGGLILLCLTADTCYSLSFIYMAEISPPRLRNTSSLVILISYFVGEMLGAFSGMIFKDYKSLASMFFILSLPMFFFYFSLQPTFYYLLKSGRQKHFLALLELIIKKNKVLPEYIKARLHLNKVHYFNSLSNSLSQRKEKTFTSKLPMTSSSLIRIDTGNQSCSFHPNIIARKFRLSLSDLDELFTSSESIEGNNSAEGYFKQKKNLLRLFAYALLVMNMYWIMGLTVFLPNQMGFNSVYLNTFFLALADLVGVSLMALFLNNTRRSVLNFFHLTTILIAATLLMLLHSSSFANTSNALSIDIFLSCKIRLSFYSMTCFIILII